MAHRKVKDVLIVSSIAAAAFISGKYHERIKQCQRVNYRFYPALPLFGSMSVKDNPHDEVQKHSLKFLNELHNFAQNLELNFGFSTVKAASPITESKVPTTQPSTSNRVSQIMKYGFPSMANVRSFDNYVLSYDQRNRVAHWVFEHLTQESVRNNEKVDRSKCDFMPDESIHPFFRSQNTDYKRSGYDRGHLAAAGNHKCQQKHVEQTFYLTNIAPQVGRGFNRDSWNRLEKHVRKLTKIYPNVFCCTGPLYLPRRDANGKFYVKYEVIGANHVAVPTHFFKIVVGETLDGNLEMESYVMANEVINDNMPLENFQVPPETIEKAAGLLFFNNVTRKNLRKINGNTNK